MSASHLNKSPRLQIFFFIRFFVRFYLSLWVSSPSIKGTFLCLSHLSLQVLPCCILHNSLLWQSSDTNKVDAISIAVLVWQVVAEMGAGGADSLTICQASYVFPDDFLVSEGWPAVCRTLLDKLVHSSSLGGNEQGLAGDAVVVCHLSTSISLDGLYPCSVSTKCVAGMFGVMSIEVTDLISCIEITSIKKILLD